MRVRHWRAAAAPARALPYPAPSCAHVPSSRHADLSAEPAGGPQLPYRAPSSSRRSSGIIAVFALQLLSRAVVQTPHPSFGQSWFTGRFVRVCDPGFLNL